MQVAERFAHLPEIERRRIEMPPHTMRLNRLERPEAWPVELRAKVLDEIAGRTPWHLYPDYPRFYNRLAEFVGVSEREIIVGAGIEEFVRSFMMLHQGKRVAILWPTCLMFEIYARAFGVDLVKIHTRPGGVSDMDFVANRIRTRWPDAVLLVNPGQPFETHFSPAEIRWLCRAFPDLWIAVDEAYYGFGASTVLGDHTQHGNLTVLRTFSKAFGAAGIRLGYTVGARQTLDYLDAVRPSGEVGALSMTVASVLMDNWPMVAEGIAEVVVGRDWLRTQFLKDGFPAWGQYGNSVVVELAEAAAHAERLAARGILVRLVDAGHLMITCGSIDLMKAFYHDFSRA